MFHPHHFNDSPPLSTYHTTHHVHTRTPPKKKNKQTTNINNVDQKNAKSAALKLVETNDDLNHLKDQITTLEVSSQRHYNQEPGKQELNSPFLHSFLCFCFLFLPFATSFTRYDAKSEAMEKLC
jgi:hypothetical protein